ncbi:queuosine precursor transporter [Pseudomonas sp. OV226]|uniref:queuosine precursor transporter n=1 Tax=Pseudomonas sp. OV226 TaxID=2135588 RepID=UPI000D7A92CC|nr:queuosine precursor transporter [Pseudomonas sp. OV226]PWK43870.1 hypothetical protein C7534_103251 [Pseudomonas sp. OV226]
MKSDNSDLENRKYKLLGFERGKDLAVIMVTSTGTGKVIKIKVSELLRSEIIDDLSRDEIKSIYKKFYSRGAVLTAYDITDRHEKSWVIYVALNLLLFALYMFTNIAATKLVYIDWLDIVVTPGVFLYPLTFLIVDMLNEFYGLGLARKAILFTFVTNVFIVVSLGATIYLPGLSGWDLNVAYGEVMSHILSVLVASSISFIFSEYVNSYLLSEIKQLTNSRFLFLRVFFSTFFASIIDSFIFCFIAFYGSMANAEILDIVYVQIAIKMCFAIFNILPAYGARSLFKRYVVSV